MYRYVLILNAYLEGEWVGYQQIILAIKSPTHLREYLVNPSYFGLRIHKPRYI